MVKGWAIIPFLLANLSKVPHLQPCVVYLVWTKQVVTPCMGEGLPILKIEETCIPEF